MAPDHEANLDAEAESELQRKLNAQLSGLLDFDVAPEAEVTEAATAEEPDELAFEFRLFGDEAPSHTVVIDQNDDSLKGLGEGKFVVPRRPDSYYVASEPDADAEASYRFAAVTSDYLLADAKQRRWGLEKPWRVTHVTISGRPLKYSLTATAEDTEMADGKRKRPGKKRRIILRTREKAQKEKAEAAKKQLETKEEHLKAKKKRLNREKKLKRRAKEKEKKSAGGGTSEQGDADKNEDISDDSSEA